MLKMLESEVEGFSPPSSKTAHLQNRQRDQHQLRRRCESLALAHSSPIHFNSHGNHLHVSSLQTAMELILVGIDNRGIVRIDTELATAYMVTERGAIWRSGLDRMLLIERHF